jgi:hypothetical protein
VFVPIAVLYLKQSLKWDYLWASLCIVGAVFFIFRERNCNDTTIGRVSSAAPQFEKRDCPTAPDQ